MSSNRDRQVDRQPARKPGIRPQEAIEAWLSDEAFEGYLIGNAIQCLACYKGRDGVRDLLQAAHFLARAIEQYPQEACPDESGESFRVEYRSPLDGWVKVVTVQGRVAAEKFLQSILQKLCVTPANYRIVAEATEVTP